MLFAHSLDPERREDSSNLRRPLVRRPGRSQRQKRRYGVPSGAEHTIFPVEQSSNLRQSLDHGLDCCHQPGFIPYIACTVQVLVFSQRNNCKRLCDSTKTIVEKLAQRGRLIRVLCPQHDEVGATRSNSLFQQPSEYGKLCRMIGRRTNQIQIGKNDPHVRASFDGSRIAGKVNW